ncbi:DUF4433 domain-containing protein [Mycobacterium terramassiliense]|uniref:DUF4433 domain-containing protein n=1 Tax=Mycobacterium terramassiliense TaxID=1841859 RepID=UPI0012FFCA89|nr:DUF4433 domain-containing protein [Mycobacterium terramassiliense]
MHYITSIANLRSIADLGILSHNLAEEIQHESIANESVQENRVDKRVPNGMLLHDYVNLYFDARNAMMYCRLHLRTAIAVVSVNPVVLDTPGTVITDLNAATSGVGFFESPGGLANLDEERVYTDDWRDPDPWVQLKQKQQRQAEVLVPHTVERQHLFGCYVCEPQVVQRCATSGLRVKVNKHVFFQ